MNKIESPKNFESLVLEFEKLRVQLEELRTVHPLRDLLRAKDLEIIRIKKAFQNVAKDHAEHHTIEGLVLDHLTEREELRNILKEAELKFDQFLTQVIKAQNTTQTNEIDVWKPKVSAPVRAPEY